MIRKAQSSDASRLAEIMVFAKRTAYRPIFNDDNGSFNEIQVLDIALEYRDSEDAIRNIYVYDDGIVKGMMNCICLEEESWQLKELYVDPFFQGEGIGRVLLEYFLNQSKENGIKSVNLWALEKNERARRFYERNGFEFSGVKELEVGTPEYLCQYIKVN